MMNGSVEYEPLNDGVQEDSEAHLDQESLPDPKTFHGESGTNGNSDINFDRPEDLLENFMEEGSDSEVLKDDEENRVHTEEKLEQFEERKEKEIGELAISNQDGFELEKPESPIKENLEQVEANTQSEKVTEVLGTSVDETPGVLNVSNQDGFELEKPDSPIKENLEEVEADSQSEKENESLELSVAQPAGEESSSDVEIIEYNDSESRPKEKTIEDITLEDDIPKDHQGDSKTSGDEGKVSEDEDELPRIRIKTNLFETVNDDDDDDDEQGEGMDPEAIQSMMEVEMNEAGDFSGALPRRPMERSAGASILRRNPRRHAAVVASNTIKEMSMSSLEKDEPKQSRKERDDVEYINTVNNTGSRPNVAESQATNQKRCHQCKMIGATLIVIRQYGTDIHLCSNNCFNVFRNPDPSARPLPCAKCGVVNRDTERAKIYYWETMNFCSDLCVGNFQVQIGFTCSTCSKKTPWACMGKYCVRFGSDIRQFCTASCLEAYKRNARVCFHCQLDIKKLGNVVLANIPSKATPKEFCSQDCVEQYIEQNITNGSRSKNPPTIKCYVCNGFRPLYKELVTSIMSYKVCSAKCWAKLLEVQLIRVPTKCETCSKYINMDTIAISPSFYVATEKKAFGFCSPTCKNVFVLKTRQIRPCTTCSVKKYNYDLIEFMSGVRPSGFAVCSLNCLPKPSAYIVNLKTKLSDPAYVPPATIFPAVKPKPSTQVSLSIPMLRPISSETHTASLPNGKIYTTSGQNTNNEIQIEGVTSLALSDCSVALSTEGSYHYQLADSNNSQYAISLITDDMQTVSEDGIIEIQDAAGVITLGNSHNAGTDPVNAEIVPLQSERWAQCDEFVVIRNPKPIPRRNKGCQIRPIRFTKETQTDCSELVDMPRIEPRVQVLVIPVPVIIPFPVFSSNQPVPVPYPVGIPVPIPIPVVLDKENARTEFTSFAIQTTHEADEDEMMDTSEPPDSDPVPPAAPISRANSFGFGNSNSPMSEGSPSVSSYTTFLSASPAPASPCVGGGSNRKIKRAEYGLRAWKLFHGEEDPATLSPEILAEKLVEWTTRGTKPKGDRYEPDTLFYFFLGIQQHLRSASRSDQIFYEPVFSKFVETLTAYAEQEMSKGRCISKVEEDHVWDANELGPVSPGVLLFTLIYYIYKNFGLKTWEEHVALEFNQVKISDRYSTAGVQQRYITIEGVTDSDQKLIEVAEEPQTPHRCLVKLLEFYSSKCETTEGAFYKSIKPLAEPRSSWYCSQSLSQMDLYHMLVRAQMICVTSTNE